MLLEKQSLSSPTGGETALPADAGARRHTAIPGRVGGSPRPPHQRPPAVALTGGMEVGLPHTTMTDLKCILIVARIPHPCLVSRFSPPPHLGSGLNRTGARRKRRSRQKGAESPR